MTDLSMLVVRYQVKKLLELGLIEKKDRLGHTQYYQLNMNNQNAKIILLLERNVISERLDRVCEDLMF